VSTAFRRKPISELQSVTCHMGLHSVTCHMIQVNVPHLSSSQTSLYSIYLTQRDGRLSWPGWLVIYQDGLHVERQSPIQVLTETAVGIRHNKLTTRSCHRHFGIGLKSKRFIFLLALFHQVSFHWYPPFCIFITEFSISRFPSWMRKSNVFRFLLL